MKTKTLQEYLKAIKGYLDAFHIYQATLRECSDLGERLLEAKKSQKNAFKKWDEAEDRRNKARAKYEDEIMKESDAHIVP